MRKSILAVITALGLVAVGSEPAQAAADITRGGSCAVSANVRIAISVNFDNTYGTPSRGDVDYVVLNSPIALIPGQTHVQFFDVNLNPNVSFAYNWARDLSKAPRYVYRADPAGIEADQVRRVEVNPKTATGVTCVHWQRIPARISSAN